MAKRDEEAADTVSFTLVPDDGGPVPAFELGGRMRSGSPAGWRASTLSEQNRATGFRGEIRLVTW
ncbi:hypothetical protein GCM10011609_76530 [Lentzea pudingi]|uniref:Uncharacterized protein n=1 Tax=Lentzea pudingi TaxID=1789439 RepID=A0ABQ2IPZ5_9PSEU|nr:hypothetical protein GCM10011609_76530 [Lentzea pudingi]